MSQPAKHDYKHYRGDTFAEGVTIYTQLADGSKGPPRDLTNWDPKCQGELEDGALVQEFNVTKVVPNTLGQIIIRAEWDQTTVWPDEFFYDLQLTDATVNPNLKRTITYGKIKVNGQRTAP